MMCDRIFFSNRVSVYVNMEEAKQLFVSKYNYGSWAFKSMLLIKLNKETA